MNKIKKERVNVPEPQICPATHNTVAGLTPGRAQARHAIGVESAGAAWSFKYMSLILVRTASRNWSIGYGARQNSHFASAMVPAQVGDQWGICTYSCEHYICIDGTVDCSDVFTGQSQLVVKSVDIASKNVF